MGKYSNQQQFEYFGIEFPQYAHYKNIQGNYYWTNMPSNEDTKINDITSQNECLTPKSNSNSYHKLII